MNNLTNSLQFNSLGAVANSASPEVLKAIQTASSKTGVDFSYLVKQAAVESSFDATAKNRGSTATGLYQFIDSTWLQMVDRYGEDYGIETDGMSKREILNLRKDPEASSFMAAAFASENERTLNDNWGGDVGQTELYLAHFMGANGASSFLNARDDNPLRTAADLFPAAARANRNVFYDSETGQARSLEEVYQFFNQKFENINTPSEQMVAQASSSPLDAQTVQTLLDAEPTNQSYVASSGISDSIVMTKALAMRQARNDQDYIHLSSLGIAPRMITTPSVKIRGSDDSSPFLTRLSNPVDVMSLAQRSDDNRSDMG